MSKNTGRKTTATSTLPVGRCCVTPNRHLDRISLSYVVGGIMKASKLEEIRGRISQLLAKARNFRTLLKELAFYGDGLVADRIQQIYQDRGAPPALDELTKLDCSKFSASVIEPWRILMMATSITKSAKPR